jgi:hypothetical protein
MCIESDTVIANSGVSDLVIKIDNNSKTIRKSRKERERE